MLTATWNKKTIKKANYLRNISELKRGCKSKKAIIQEELINLERRKKGKIQEENALEHR